MEIVFLLDDDARVREALGGLLQILDRRTETCAVALGIDGGRGSKRRFM
jgi:FixJ family two-component response regulator